MSATAQASPASSWLVFRVGPHHLCAATEAVQAIVEPPRLTRLPGAPGHLLGVFAFRGQYAVAVDLAGKLGVAAAGAAGRRPFIVARVQDRLAAFQVDEAQDVMQPAQAAWQPMPALLGDELFDRYTIANGALILHTSFAALLNAKAAGNLPRMAAQLAPTPPSAKDAAPRPTPKGVVAPRPPAPPSPPASLPVVAAPRPAPRIAAPKPAIARTAPRPPAPLPPVVRRAPPVVHRTLPPPAAVEPAIEPLQETEAATPPVQAPQPVQASEPKREAAAPPALHPEPVQVQAQPLPAPAPLPAAPRGVPRANPTVAEKPRRSLAPAVLALAAVLGVTVGAWWFHRETPPPAAPVPPAIVPAAIVKSAPARPAPPPEPVAGPEPAAGGDAGPPTRAPAVYVVAPGDTLSQISQKHLGSARHYRQLAERSGVRDPHRIYPGDRLRLEP